MVVAQDSTAALYAPVVEVRAPEASGEVLLVCEHASNRVPAHLEGLGLTHALLDTHIAWDPGALDLALAMSARMGAAVVAGCVSRLVYDCNRPPEAPGAMPSLSEVHTIPGNETLSDAARAERIAHVYEPVHAAVARELAARKGLRALLTVHSFTPVYRGEQRQVEIGLLHGEDTRLALAMLAASQGAPFDVQLNAPYGPGDGVSHMVDRHAGPAGLPTVMIEVRSDLLMDEPTREQIAGLLCDWFAHGIAVVEKGPAR